MIYFTADTHFGHCNVIRFCDRPFASAEEMDEAMIQNWNERVTGNDTVYILGDKFLETSDGKRSLTLMPLPDAFVKAREAVIYDPRAYS